MAYYGDIRTDYGERLRMFPVDSEILPILRDNLETVPDRLVYYLIIGSGIRSGPSE